ncbi:MAG: hypothetical protein KDK70_15030 [Myxococcales bacterium]|nr:hypothetical protein [Myxococcales bacterium]
MTVAQLAQAAGMEIDQVVALVLGTGDKVKAAPASKRGRKGGRKAAVEAVVAEVEEAEEAEDDGSEAPGEHNTRTRAGREALDKAIIDYLKSQPEPVRALDIRKGIGGTAAQIRTRLNYLIERNKVTYKGRASGTRYKAK